MEDLKNIQRSQIVVSFYQKNEAKQEFHTINIFEQFGVTSKKVYCAIARVECEESNLQRKGTTALETLSKLKGNRSLKWLKTTTLLCSDV